jgi:hypothetical protein
MESGNKMFTIISFVIAVFAWDSFKKFLRGPKKPTVTMGNALTHQMGKPKIVLAHCGCRVYPFGDFAMTPGAVPAVETPCTAHSAMLGVIK